MTDEAPRSRRRLWMPVFATLVAATALAWAFAVFPGESTWDTVVQYRQGMTGAFSDAHPVAYALLLGASGHLFGDGRLALLAQLGVGATGLTVVARGLAGRGWLAQAAMVVLALSPLMWGQWSILWKDQPMSVLVLLGFGLLTLGRWAPAAGVFVLACLFRHNAITLIVPLAVWLGWELGRRSTWWRGTAVAIGWIALALVTPKALDAVVDAAETHAAAPSLVFDLGGVYSRAPEVYEAGPYAGVLPRQAIVKRHAPWSARRITSDRRGLPGLRHKDLQDPEAYATLRTAWTEAVLARPDAWLAHRAEFGCWFLNLCMPGAFEATATTRAEYAEIFGIPDRQRTAWQLADRLRTTTRPLGVGWLWLGLVVAGGLVALVRRSWVDVAIAASALSYLAGNLLLAPSAPFRYHLPLVMAAVVLVPRALRRGGVRAPAPAASE